MEKTYQMAIKFKHDKNGKKRAYRYSRLQHRWFPIGREKAEILLASEEAYQVPSDADFA